MKEHRWSGWPGAVCLDCGSPDLTEEALAGDCPTCVIEQGLELKICPVHTNGPCPA